MTRRKKVVFVAGARPNFMKIACLLKECRKYKAIRAIVVHSGQHYDNEMSEQFFKDLDIAPPRYFLGVGSGSHAEQTGRVMVAFEKICQKERPDYVVVVGDVNSTVAACLAAKKCHIRVAHIEAGLRSFDMAMPEEINRMVTDSISDDLFVTEQSGVTHLRKEGHAAKKIHFVGNTMIDSLILAMKKIQRMDPRSWTSYPLQEQLSSYGLLTLHRPSNVDSKTQLKRLLAVVDQVAQEIPIIFPAHPRTRKSIREFKVKLSKNIHLTHPLGYLEFIFLCQKAGFILTDSGGIQEETTFLKVPCFTLRANTERPVTLEKGTNILVGNNIEQIPRLVHQVLRGQSRAGQTPPLWDGRASQRIIKILVRKLMI